MRVYFYRFINDVDSPGLFVVPQDKPVARVIHALRLIRMVSDAEEWVNQADHITDYL